MTVPTKDEVAAMVDRLRAQFDDSNQRDAADPLEAITSQLAASDAAREAAEARVGELEKVLRESRLSVADMAQKWELEARLLVRIDAALKGAKP